MAKRKAREIAKAASDSDLSPPPEGLLDVPTIDTEPPRKKRQTKANSKQVDAANEKDLVAALPKAAKLNRKSNVDTKVEELEEKGEVVEKKVKRKRNTKEEKEAEQMPLAERTLGHKLFIGAHVSGAGGVHNSVTNGVHIGANAFALFLKSQRKWDNPALADDVCASFHSNCEKHSYDQTKHVVPHGSYLVNLAHTDTARTTQAYDAFLDDLKRCERMGIKLYNFHPGNSVGNDRQDAIRHLAQSINRAHKETSKVVTLLENMAAGGNVLGSTFEDLRDIISHVEDKERVGVCLDTCHAFAAGYDLRSPEAFEATMSTLDDVVGVKYLRAVHLNDSKAPLASHRDLHANIGTGFLGLRAFHNLVNDSRFEGLPLVLETPIDVVDEDGKPIKAENGKDQKEDKGIWAREIKLLESLVGMDVESEEFLRMEKELARKGEPERKKLSEQQDRKREKEEKKAKSPGKKRQKKVVRDEGESESALSELDDR